MLIILFQKAHQYRDLPSKYLSQHRDGVYNYPLINGLCIAYITRRITRNTNGFPLGLAAGNTLLWKRLWGVKPLQLPIGSLCCGH